MADPPGAGSGQSQCYAEIERQFRPLEWPVVPGGLVRDKLMVRAADLRYTGLQYLVRSSGRRTNVGDVASLDL